MQRFRHDATVHPGTVTRLSRAEVEVPKRYRVVQRGTLVRDSYSLKPDPRVWAAAQRRLRELRPHGYTRIQTIDAKTVVIR